MIINIAQIIEEMIKICANQFKQMMLILNWQLTILQNVYIEMPDMK